jgi:hypothetical protein
MRPTQLAKRIEELLAKLTSVPSEGIRIDFSSFTEPEQLVLLKNAELDKQYRNNWPDQVVLENKELIVKANQIIINRVVELFLFAMPRALMFDEVEQWFFQKHFDLFLEGWIICKDNLNCWSEKDRQNFLLELKTTQSKQ